MMGSLFTVDASVLSEIAKALQSPTATQLRPPAGIPSVDQIGRLLELAAWVSVQRDEGRPVRFALACVDPNEALPDDFALRLKDEVTGGELRRLVVALNSRHTPVLVHPTENGWAAWGLMALFRQQDGSPLVTAHVVVRAIGPGNLVVERGGEPICVVNLRQTFLRVIPEWMQAHLLRELWGEPLDSEVVIAIGDIVSRMISIGHGGTLVVVSASEEERLLACVRFRHRFQKPGAVLQTKIVDYQRWSANQRDALLDFTPTKLLRVEEACERVAELSATDGSVVVTHHMEVVGFGATLDVSAAPQDLVVLAAATDWREFVETPLAQLGGTRHQSVARWLAAPNSPRPALAYTVSSDGDCHLFSRNQEGRVCRWGPLHLALQADPRH